MMVIKRLEYGFGTLYTYQPKPPSTTWWFYQQMAEVGNKDQGVEVSGYQVNNINYKSLACVFCSSPSQYCKSIATFILTTHIAYYKPNVQIYYVR